MGMDEKAQPSGDDGLIGGRDLGGKPILREAPRRPTSEARPSIRERLLARWRRIGRSWRGRESPAQRLARM